MQTIEEQIFVHLQVRQSEPPALSYVQGTPALFYHKPSALLTQGLTAVASVLVQTGFLDSNAYIRELTLKSMLSLGPRMSQKTLNNSVLKHLSKLQV
eukprot:132619-Pelagomonas_calceolata.AAC.2